MAIDFNNTFGAGSQQNTSGVRSTTGQRQRPNDLPKAKVWLNVGYVAEGVEEDGSDRFVSLPMGIPLDNMEKLPTSSRNQSYAQFQAARNDLLDQLLEAAQSLAPGEDMVVGIGVGLAIQIRRVGDDRPEPATDNTNPFARQLMFKNVD